MTMLEGVDDPTLPNAQRVTVDRSQATIAGWAYSWAALVQQPAYNHPARSPRPLAEVDEAILEWADRVGGGTEWRPDSDAEARDRADTALTMAVPQSEAISRLERR